MKIHPFIFSIMLIICILFITTRKSDSLYYDKHTKEIKKYNTKIDSISKKNTLYLDSIDVLDLKIYKLQIELKNIQSQIELNKIQYDEKINAVNIFTDRELQEFFTKRYFN